jgi:GNAT superfamily N-acetyltransferase
VGYSASMAEDAYRYPVELERTVTLRDGSTIGLRPIRSDDVGRLKAFHGRLSRDSIFFRFFSPLPVLTDARAAYFTTVDYDRRLALVATDGSGDAEVILGVARYDRVDEERAEVALIVEDRMQQHGIGSVLLAAIVDAARTRGVRVLSADVLSENRRMLRLLRASGLRTRSRRVHEAIHLELDLTAVPDPPSTLTEPS